MSYLVGSLAFACRPVITSIRLSVISIVIYKVSLASPTAITPSVLRYQIRWSLLRLLQIICTKFPIFLDQVVAGIAVQASANTYGIRRPTKSTA